MRAEEPGTLVLRVTTPSRAPGLWRVDVEGHGRFLVESATARALGVSPGGCLSHQVLEALVGAAARQAARDVALGLLKRRLRSQRELEAALRRRHIPHDSALAVLGELRQAGWIDDRRFAEAWVRDRLALRPCGRRRLRAELLARGVPVAIADTTIAAALAQSGEEDLALAQARIRMRRMRGLPPEVARRRLVAWLRRRGFDGEVVVRVLKALPLAPATPLDVDTAS